MMRLSSTILVALLGQAYAGKDPKKCDVSYDVSCGVLTDTNGNEYDCTYVNQSADEAKSINSNFPGKR